MLIISMILVFIMAFLLLMQNIAVMKRAKAAVEQANENRMLAIRKFRQEEKADEAEIELLESMLEAEPGKRLEKARIDINELSLSDLIDNGPDGQIYRGSWNGAMVSVRRILKTNINEESIARFKHELELSLAFRHPNVLGTFGGCWTIGDTNVAYVSELAERGSLEMMLFDPGPDSEPLSWKAHKMCIALGIARGMSYLHSRSPPLCHRDLKSSNVHVDGGYNPKICDWACITECPKGTKLTDSAGTPIYSAPEVLRDEPYDKSCDVWSFACLLEEMWTHRRVFEYSGVEDLADRVAHVTDGELTPLLPEGCFLEKVMMLTGARDPAHRIVRAHLARIHSPKPLPT